MFSFLLSCATALVLLVDVSGSVSDPNYQLQTKGTASAFRDAEIQQSIIKKPGGIAVSYIEWGSGQYISIEWRLLKTKEDIDAFANEIEGLTRTAYLSNDTQIGFAVERGISYLQNAPCDISKATKVLDVSGDGKDLSSSYVLKAMKAYAEDNEITINGLPILASEKDIAAYYKEYVITSNGFVRIAKEFSDFPKAILIKLRDELL